jgi:hypothetical protein
VLPGAAGAAAPLALHRSKPLFALDWSCVGKIESRKFYGKKLHELSIILGLQNEIVMELLCMKETIIHTKFSSKGSW